jgi:hypothetical protein
MPVSRLGRIAAITASLFALASAPAAPPPLVPGAEHIVIQREAGVWSNFPIIYQLPDETRTLSVQFGARMTASHLEPRSDRMNFVSTDGGRTWTKSPRAEPNPAWATGPSRPGRLVKPDAHAWRYVEASRRAEFEARGIEVRNSPDGRVTYAYGCYVSTSEDGGATWEQREIEVPAKGLIMTYHDPASYLRLDARTILRAVYGKPVANIRHYEVWLLRSEDDGATWNFSTLAADPEKKRSYGETALVQAGNGDLVAMMRTEPSLGSKMWSTRSADRGRTWTKPVETPLLGHPAHLLRLRDGTLLCTYGHRDAPIGIRAAFSHDHGRTWPEDEIVALRADGATVDSGYPISTELADGTLVSVYYLTRDGITGVEATRWLRPHR